MTTSIGGRFYHLPRGQDSTVKRTLVRSGHPQTLQVLRHFLMYGQPLHTEYLCAATATETSLITESSFGI